MSRNVDSIQRKHWALAILCLLRERDMHPYEMRLVMRERHKEDRLVLKSGSLYHAIAWLEEHQLIECAETVRAGKRPQRSIYKLVPAGEIALSEWLKELLAAPAREGSSFAVALDHAVHLEPAEVADQLEKRVGALGHRVEAMEVILATLSPRIGRINLIEVEFERAICRAELEWLKQIVEEIRSGKFAWNIQQILAYLRIAAARRPASGKPNEVKRNRNSMKQQ